jgi:hypothetical protein
MKLHPLANHGLTLDTATTTATRRWAFQPIDEQC